MFAEKCIIPFGKREKQINCKYQKIEQERKCHDETAKQALGDGGWSWVRKSWCSFWGECDTRRINFSKEKVAKKQ